MADSPQDPPRHAGQVVRRVLLRRNIAIDPETAQLGADAVQAVFRPPTAPPCSDPTGADFLAPTAGRSSTWRSR